MRPPTPARPLTPARIWAVLGLVLCLLGASTGHALRGASMLRLDGAHSHPHHETPNPPESSTSHEHCLLCTIQFTEPGPADEETGAWLGVGFQPRLAYTSPHKQRQHHLPNAPRAPPRAV